MDVRSMCAPEFLHRPNAWSAISEVALHLLHSRCRGSSKDDATSTRRAIDRALYHRLLPIAAESGTRNARYDEAFCIVRTTGRLRAELNEQVEFAGEVENIRGDLSCKAQLHEAAGDTGLAVAVDLCVSNQVQRQSFVAGLENPAHDIRP